MFRYELLRSFRCLVVFRAYILIYRKNLANKVITKQTTAHCCFVLSRTDGGTLISRMSCMAVCSSCMIIDPRTPTLRTTAHVGISPTKRGGGVPEVDVQIRQSDPQHAAQRVRTKKTEHITKTKPPSQVSLHTTQTTPKPQEPGK